MSYQLLEGVTLVTIFVLGAFIKVISFPKQGTGEFRMMDLINTVSENGVGFLLYTIFYQISGEPYIILVNHFKKLDEWCCFSLLFLIWYRLKKEGDSL